MRREPGLKIDLTGSELFLRQYCLDRTFEFYKIQFSRAKQISAVHNTLPHFITLTKVCQTLNALNTPIFEHFYLSCTGNNLLFNLNIYRLTKEKINL